jgi:hypothetical protein
LNRVRPSLLVYVHPVTGLAATLLLAWAASQGLRARRDRPTAPAARRRHAAIAPWAYGSVLASWLAGLVTIWTLCPDAEVAASGHFSVGSGICALLTAAALVSRRIPDATARIVHPLLGATALLLCGVQVFLGLQLLP